MNDREAAEAIVNGVLALIKVYNQSQFRLSRTGVILLSEALNGRITDTYRAAAFQILAVLNLTPEGDLSDLPDIPESWKGEKREESARSVEIRNRALPALEGMQKSIERRCP
jgi:hypothetical protein